MVKFIRAMVCQTIKGGSLERSGQLPGEQQAVSLQCVVTVCFIWLLYDLFNLVNLYYFSTKLLGWFSAMPDECYTQPVSAESEVA